MDAWKSKSAAVCRGYIYRNRQAGETHTTVEIRGNPIRMPVTQSLIGHVLNAEYEAMTE